MPAKRRQLPKRKRQRWGVGDVFLIRLKDRSYVVGQIVGREREMMNSVSVALFGIRVRNPRELPTIPLRLENAFSVLFTTHDQLSSGRWRIVGQAPVLIPRKSLPWEWTRRRGWVDAEMHGSAIVTEFVNAFYRLCYWDDWADPKYLDGLLTSPRRKPARLKLKWRRGLKPGPARQ